MYESLQSKRTLMLVFLWILFALFILFNVGMVTIGLSLSTGAILQPVGNVIIIIAWVFIKSSYNDANAKLKHMLHLESMQKENDEPVSYGKIHNLDYVPDLVLDDALFQHIVSGKDHDKIMLDPTIAEYVSPGRQIKFHDSSDYGYLRRIEVLSAKSTDKGILTHYKRM